MVSVVSPWKNDGQLLLLPLQLQVSAIWLLCIFLTVSALMLLLPLLLEYASGQQKFLKKGGQTKQGNPSLCLLLVPSIPKNIMMFIQDIQVPHQNGQCLGVRFFGQRRIFFASSWTSMDIPSRPLGMTRLAWSSGELRTAGSQ